MTQKEILEGNKLIAKFMGARPYYLNDNVITFPAFENPQPSISGTTTHNLDSLKYNTSWDWLMSVVEKIRDNNCIVSIRFNRQLNTTNTMIANFEDGWKKDIDISGVGVESTFKAVVEFIKWYNNQKK